MKAAIATGVAADLLLGDPRRAHPVAAFGRLAAGLERRTYADRRAAGVLHTGVLVAGVALASVPLRRSPVALTVATWAALGGASLAREGAHMGALLTAGDLPAGRARLSHLCARDATDLGADELARATVESLAENTSDAAVAPLFWAAVAGVPGVLAYRAINTLDAMVGYRSDRYARFGWAAARLDDLVNLAPARITAALTVALAPVVGGSSARAWAAWRRDGAHHPSPNAGHCEAAFAGALGRSLGGTNVYHGAQQDRGTLGDGPGPGVADIARAVRLSRAVTLAAAVLVVLLPRGRGVS